MPPLALSPWELYPVTGGSKVPTTPMRCVLHFFAFRTETVTMPPLVGVTVILATPFRADRAVFSMPAPLTRTRTPAFGLPPSVTVTEVPCGWPFALPIFVDPPAGLQTSCFGGGWGCGLGFRLGCVDDAIAMVRRSVERVELHRA